MIAAVSRKFPAECMDLLLYVLVAGSSLGRHSRPLLMHGGAHAPKMVFTRGPGGHINPRSVAGHCFSEERGWHEREGHAPDHLRRHGCAPDGPWT
jgi:hypothetical protein